MPQRTNREMIQNHLSDVPHYFGFILLIGITLWAEYQVFSLFVPGSAALLRWCGLATTEVGAFGWQFYHKNRKKRRSSIQLSISFVMIWVDILAAVLCLMFELLAEFAFHGYGMDNSVISTIILVAIALIMGANLVAYFLTWHYSPEHVDWLNAPADQPYTPTRITEGASGGRDERRQPAIQQPKPQVRIEEEKQRQPALPPPARRGDPNLYAPQQPSQHLAALPSGEREDDDPFLARSGKAKPQQSGGNTQGRNGPYQQPPTETGQKKQMPPYDPLAAAQRAQQQSPSIREQIAHPRDQRQQKPVIEPLQSRQVIEAETVVLPQTHAPSEQWGP